LKSLDEEVEGSNLKGMVLSWPVVVVAAKVMLSFFKAGIKKVDVQPAPRIKKSTDFEFLSSSGWAIVFSLNGIVALPRSVVDDDENESFRRAGAPPSSRDCVVRPRHSPHGMSSSCSD
jgi:hypothetical protein